MQQIIGLKHHHLMRCRTATTQLWQHTKTLVLPNAPWDQRIFVNGTSKYENPLSPSFWWGLEWMMLLQLQWGGFCSPPTPFKYLLYINQPKCSFPWNILKKKNANPTSTQPTPTAVKLWSLEPRYRCWCTMKFTKATYQDHLADQPQGLVVGW